MRRYRRSGGRCLRPCVHLAALAALLSMAALVAPRPALEPAGPPSAPVDGDWWSRVTEDLAAREYRASAHPDGLQAPNRAQNLRTVFAADGVTVMPRTVEPAWRWSWTTTDWGRRGATASAGPATPLSRGQRVEYARDGLVEWYENRAEGVEQGFTVAAAPPGAGELVVHGTVTGDLAALVEGGDHLRFTDAAGAGVLDYAGLAVWDAAGRDLPARLDWRDGRLEIAVDDHGAVYPVTIDPLLYSPDWTEPGDRSDAEFGWTVATAGDVNGDGYSDVVIGSPHWSTTGTDVRGKAWVYHGSASGLTSSPAWEYVGDHNTDQFGWAVATAGDVNGDGYDDVIVGAPTYEGPSDQDGRAYIFFGSSSGLSVTADWEANGGSASTSLYFGRAVGTAGDLDGDGYDDIVVGDPFINSHGGRISVWYGGPSGPDSTVDWYAYGPSLRLGHAVGTAGDVNGDGYDDMLIGAPDYTNGDADEGAVFVWHGGPGGVSGGADDVVQSDLDYFHMGYSASLAGDIDGDGYGDIVVGCLPDIDFMEEWPHIRVYRGSETGLEPTVAWTWGAHLTSETLGRHVGCGGDLNGDGYADILVGDPGVGASEGRLMAFFGSFDGLPTTYRWLSEGDADWLLLGPVATAGDVNGDGYSDIIGGAPGYEPAGTGRGEARCWYGGPYQPRRIAGWVTESNQADALFGYSLAPAGDVNGDGYGDVLVGAPAYDNGEINEGAVFLYLGSHQGLGWVPPWYAEGDDAYANFGASVASAGDVNGDGLPDILVGAPGMSVSEAGEGGAYVWHSVLGGGPMGTPANADWSYVSGQADADLGRSVACAGDVNGDGYADVIVGAPDYDHGTIDEGMVFAFHGAAGGLSAVPNWTHDTGKADCSYGFSVASAGDMNGDGYSDVIVGAPTYDHPSDREGLAFVYLGSPTGLDPGAPWWWAQSDQALAQLGYSVAGAGDVNGDGYSDVIVGSPYWDASYNDAGQAQIWYGAAAAPVVGTGTNADWDHTYDNTAVYFGFSVASAGDVNADGYSDVIVGLPGQNFSGDIDAGMAEVFHGSPSGPSTYSDWFDGGSQVQAYYGYRVASAGDVNGDGFGDIVIGAPYHDEGQANEGRVFLYYGNETRGLARTPRMYHADETTRLAPLGMSDSRTAFAIGVRGRTAYGRDLVRMECEVKEHGTAFTGTGKVAGDWTDTGAPSGAPGSVVEMTQVVSGLTAATPYVWRVRQLGDSPYFPRTPWITQSWNGLDEWVVRTESPVSAAGDVPRVAGGLTNHPNPFNPTTTFRYRLARGERVRLQLYDTRGRLVRTLVDAVQPDGEHRETWDGRDDAGRPLASGVYLARLRAGDRTERHKVTLIK